MTTKLKNTNLRLDGVARCSGCSTIKPKDQFHADCTRTSGVCSRCRACETKRSADRTMVRELIAIVKKNPSYASLILRTAERQQLAA